MLIALIIFQFPEDYLRGVWTAELGVIQAEVTTIRKRLGKLKKRLRKDKGIKDKLDAYNAQVIKLNERSKQVDRIIKTKTNPKQLLDRLARNMPNDLWLDSLSINGSREVLIKGAATTYKSIGDFIILGNQSPFFGNTLNLTNSETVEETLDGIKVRLEKFEIKGQVETYDPFIQ
jgi:Tfp pilus assembly protein PilN